MMDFINDIDKEELTYGSLFEPSRVIAMDGDRHLFVEVNNRIGTYSKVLIAGKTYFPKKNDLGLLMYVGKFKYPVFLPAFFDGIFKEGTDVKITYKTDKYGGDKKAYTQDELAWLAKEYGFLDSELEVITAIAMAENRGIWWTDNRGLNTNGTIDVGLWQVNTSHAKEIGKSIDDYIELMKNPINNAIEAHRIYKIQGFKAWSTYNNGAYKAFKRKVIPTKPNH